MGIETMEFNTLLITQIVQVIVTIKMSMSRAHLTHINAHTRFTCFGIGWVLFVTKS